MSRKSELKNKRIELLKEIEEVDKALAQLPDTLLLTKIDKKFKDFSLNEINDLALLSDSAMEFFTEENNSNLTIEDFNATQIVSKNKIIVEQK